MNRVYMTALALTCALAPLAPAHAGGDPAAGKAKAAVCAACHGVDGNGNGVNPLWPKLAGQHEAYLAKQIRAFKSGERTDPTMAPMINLIKEEDIDDIAAYYASQKPK